MTLRILQSESVAARRRVYFLAVDSLDGATPETGLTGTGYISKNGGTPAASTNSVVEIDATNMPGWYYLELTAAEVDTLGTIEVRYKDAACAEVVARAMVVPTDPYVSMSDKVEDWVYGASMAFHEIGSTYGEIMTDVIVSGHPSIPFQLAEEVFDEALAAHATAGTFGAVVADILSDIETDGVVITAATIQAVADELLKRDFSAVSGEAARSVLSALRFLRNRWAEAGGTLTIYEENDTAPAWTATVTRNSGYSPITGVDPSD
jgi:ribosomal protein L25 (general stress protein Ctc)